MSPLATVLVGGTERYLKSKKHGRQHDTHPRATPQDELEALGKNRTLEAVAGTALVVCALKVVAAWGKPAVTAPEVNVSVVTPAGRAAAEVVQTTLSVVVPTVRTHVAVALLVSKLTAVVSTALKQFLGTVNTIAPPTGTTPTVAVLKPRVAVPALRVPGTLSAAVVNAMATPAVS